MQQVPFLLKAAATSCPQQMGLQEVLGSSTTSLPAPLGSSTQVRSGCPKVREVGRGHGEGALSPAPSGSIPSGDNRVGRRHRSLTTRQGRRSRKTLGKVSVSRTPFLCLAQHCDVVSPERKTKRARQVHVAQPHRVSPHPRVTQPRLPLQLSHHHSCLPSPQHDVAQLLIAGGNVASCPPCQTLSPSGDTA